MASYSNFFSSGLLAPSQIMSDSRAHTPAPPSSPMMLPTTPVDPIDRKLTPLSTYLEVESAPKYDDMLISPGPINKNTITTTNGVPRLRKRRSSLSMAASPMAGIKSATRNAGTALQRTGFMSPSRSRSGSINEYGLGVATEQTSLTGRMRSGSLGGVLRSRRVIRKASGPAPTAPLPAIPLPSIPSSAPPTQLSFTACQPHSLPSINFPQTNPTFALNGVAAPNPRRPLTHRFNHLTSQSQTQHNPNSLSVTSPEFTSKLMAAMTTPPASPMRSPIEGGHGAYYFSGEGYRIDEDMKEN